MFHTRGSDHLEISTHIHPIRIQVYFTKNTKKVFSCPKSQRVHRDFLSLDTYNYEPVKTEWSQSWRTGIFSFLRVSTWWPPVCHHHKS